MGLNIDYEEGQTPLDEDEKDGLLIQTVSTRAELDEVEQRNIEDAILWTVERRRRFTVDEVLSEQFINALHVKMLGEVWQWSGQFRTTNKNIGVDKYQISIELRNLIDDCKYWIKNKVYSPDEIAVRFKHRLVSIHCFPNGNGRHSRLMGDIIIEKLFGEPVFSWGGKNLIQKGEFRTLYLQALREADNGNYELLIKFARS